jgi:hypothetical protein
MLQRCRARPTCIVCGRLLKRLSVLMAVVVERGRQLQNIVQTSSSLHTGEALHTTAPHAWPRGQKCMFRAMISTFSTPRTVGTAPRPQGARWGSIPHPQPNCLCTGDGDLCCFSALRSQESHCTCVVHGCTRVLPPCSGKFTICLAGAECTLRPPTKGWL